MRGISNLITRIWIVWLKGGSISSIFSNLQSRLLLKPLPDTKRKSKTKKIQILKEALHCMSWEMGEEEQKQ